MTGDEFDSLKVGDRVRHIRSHGAFDVTVEEHDCDKIAVRTIGKEMEFYQIDRRARRDLSLVFRHGTYDA